MLDSGSPWHVTHIQVILDVSNQLKLTVSDYRDLCSNVCTINKIQVGCEDNALNVPILTPLQVLQMVLMVTVIHDGCPLMDTNNDHRIYIRSLTKKFCQCLVAVTYIYCYGMGYRRLFAQQMFVVYWIVVQCIHQYNLFAVDDMLFD